uniref:Uncharacterized protein n=1 Tax=Molossus molossus TaxID=27622 RepID=A0A7J8C927_MOLMO|nr:hypothetical protein HJG59_009971 [Molossus molossus]
MPFLTSAGSPSSQISHVSIARSQEELVGDKPTDISIQDESVIFKGTLGTCGPGNQVGCIPPVSRTSGPSCSDRSRSWRGDPCVSPQLPHGFLTNQAQVPVHSLKRLRSPVETGLSWSILLWWCHFPTPSQVTFCSLHF